jgi:hypothetical protein
LGGEEYTVNHSSVLRRLLSLITALLLLAFAWLSVSDGLRNLRQARTLGQHAETLIRFACGLLSVAVVVTRFRWGFVSRPVRIAWAATLAAAVGLSALVWGPPMVHIAVINAVVALLVGWALIWALGPALAA